jgi:hypothetical protein
MSESRRRYWAIRTDTRNIPLLLAELQAGRLRQGWGYDSSQDLRLVQEEISRGGQWGERLNEDQKEVLGHLKMLASSGDGVKIGDWVLLPNLPERGPFFLVAEVIGDYYFEMMALNKESDPNSLGTDYGHVLPVRLITNDKINKYSDAVDAAIRSTLKTRSRMWNVDAYGDAINRLINQYASSTNSRIDFSTAIAGAARLKTAWEIARSDAANRLEERLGNELDARFQAAEWEEPITIVMKNLYPGTEIRWVAGSNERGADVIVELSNHFGGLNWLIVLQVKNYAGEIGASVLDQLELAYNAYSKDGKILSLIVLTTAEHVSDTTIEMARTLEDKLKTPVKFILRNELIKILSDGLMARLTD